MADRLATPDPWAARRAEIARLLDRFAVETGDRRFAHAAGVLRGRKAGRRAIDDTKALALAESMFSAGIAETKTEACRVAAKYYAPLHQVNATSVRLRRKLCTKLIKCMAEK